MFTSRLGNAYSELAGIRLGEPDSSGPPPSSLPALVDQAAIELVYVTSPNALLDQAAIELVFSGVPAARLDQLAIELVIALNLRGSVYVSGSLPASISSYVY